MARRVSLTDQPDIVPLNESTLVAAPGRVLVALRAHQLLLALLGCYLALGVVASLLIPPWQSPDEPGHFEYVRNLQLGVADESPEVQRPIIASLYSFHFWQYAGHVPPSLVPLSLTDPSLHLLRQTDKTPLYYWLAGLVSRWTDDTILQLYSIRWLSVLLSALTIPLAYATAREVLPAERAGLALLAAALVVFLPMYEYIGASVNPDNIGAPLAATTVFLAVRTLRGKQPVASAFGAIVVAGLAFWARRSTVACLPWIGLVVGACALGWIWRRLPRVLSIALIGLGCAVALAAVAWPSDAVAAWRAVGSTWGAPRSNLYAYEGLHSLRIARSAGARQAALVELLPDPRVRALVGRPITLDAMVRSASAPVTGSLAMVSNGKRAFQSAFIATPDWQRVTLSYVVPTDTASLYITLAATGPGELFFDRVRVLDAHTGAPAARVSNMGGEEALLWWQQRFPQNRMVQYLMRIIQSAFDGVYSSPEALALYPWFLYQLFSSLYGRFGWMNVGLSDGLYLAVGLVCVGLLLGLTRTWRSAGGLEANQRRALAWMALLVILAIVTLFLEYTPYLYAPTYPQGRYLFPVLVPIVCLLVSGLAQLLPARHDQRGTLVALGLLIGLSAWCWAGVIVPHFYR